MKKKAESVLCWLVGLYSLGEAYKMGEHLTGQSSLLEIDTLLCLGALFVGSIMIIGGFKSWNEK